MGAAKRPQILGGEAAQASRNYFYIAAHPQTGLTPEYANFDGSLWTTSHNPDAILFGTDAWRTAMNWSFDWAWWEKDNREQEVERPHSGVFESTKVWADMAINILLKAKRWIETILPALWRLMQSRVWRQLIPGRSNLSRNLGTLIFCRTNEILWWDVHMLAVLHCSGEFRIWKPQ